MKYGDWFEKSDVDGSEDASGSEDALDEEQQANQARSDLASPDFEGADAWLQGSDGGSASGSDDEDDEPRSGASDEEGDEAHAAMLDTVLARKRKARQHLEPISEAIPEGEANAGAASDAGGALAVAELMDAAGLDKVERKRLARVAKGTEVRPPALAAAMFSVSGAANLHGRLPCGACERWGAAVF